MTNTTRSTQAEITRTMPTAVHAWTHAEWSAVKAADVKAEQTKLMAALKAADLTGTGALAALKAHPGTLMLDADKAADEAAKLREQASDLSVAATLFGRVTPEACYLARAAGAKTADIARAAGFVPPGTASQSAPQWKANKSVTRMANGYELTLKVKAERKAAGVTGPLPDALTREIKRTADGIQSPVNLTATLARKVIETADGIVTPDAPVRAGKSDAEIIVAHLSAVANKLGRDDVKLSATERRDIADRIATLSRQWPVAPVEAAPVAAKPTGARSRKRAARATTAKREAVTATA